MPTPPGVVLAGLHSLRVSEASQDQAPCVTSLRAFLDYAAYLIRHGDGEATAVQLEEARAIGHRLRCQPALNRASTLAGAKSSVRA